MCRAFFGALKCAVELAGVNASQRFVCKEIEGIEQKQRKRSKQDDELVDVEDARLSEMRTRNSALDLKRHLLTVEIIKNIGDWPAASEGTFLPDTATCHRVPVTLFSSFFCVYGS